MTLTSVEICAGGGGQALGLEQAGFQHAAVAEIDPDACATLRHNRPRWKVVEGDIANFYGRPYEGVDLLAGGIPCPPWSVASKQLGPEDERNLFPGALRLVEEIMPGAVLLENVKGLAEDKFAYYRKWIMNSLRDLGYRPEWKLLLSSAYGVPQLRPRFVLVALHWTTKREFTWPLPTAVKAPTVGEALYDLMAAGGWPGAASWAAQARRIAPTIVGGSKKHGGPDLGPTRARAQWKELGVEGISLANEPPAADFPLYGHPRLTTPMVARLQGFPDDWEFIGTKTARYRQVGNALPPPVARALGEAIAGALR